MTLEQIVKLFVEHGAAAGLAVFAIYMLRQSYEQRAAESARLEALHKGTIEAILENTRVLTLVAERLGRLAKAPDAAPRAPRRLIQPGS